MADCIFCEIVSGSASSFGVYSDRHSVAFMDINPAVPGHVLVVPRDHVAGLWDIPEDTASEVMAAAVRVARMIKEAFHPDGMNILHATGRAGFQTVFHFHLHLLPRRFGDPIRPPWTPTEGRSDLEELARMAGRIRSAG